MLFLVLIFLNIRHFSNSLLYLIERSIYSNSELKLLTGHVVVVYFENQKHIEHMNEKMESK